MAAFKQNIAAFVKGLESKLTDTVVRSSSETVVQNAKRDEKCKGLQRKASAGSCTYCEEHNNVYTIEEVDAGKMGGRHDACKCFIGPMFERKTKQKLDKLYENYKKSDFDVKEAREYLKEAEKIGDIVYKKPLSSFRVREERDLFVHVALHRKGLKFTVRKENAPDGFSNIDLKIRGKLWEVKSPTAVPKADGKVKFIESNVAKAKKQFKNHYPCPIRKCRIIFSNRYTNFDDDFVLEELEKELKKKKIETCLFVDKKGIVSKIK